MNTRSWSHGANAYTVPSGAVDWPGGSLTPTCEPQLDKLTFDEWWDVNNMMDQTMSHLYGEDWAQAFIYYQYISSSCMMCQIPQNYAEILQPYYAAQAYVSSSIIPSTQYPTLQPFIDTANQGGTAVIYPLSLAGATTKFVEQGSGLNGMVRHSWNLPPEVILSPRGTIRLQPTRLAGYSTLLSAAIPAGVGVLNAGEIHLRTATGELTSTQSRQQHIVNATATGVGVGGAWFIPAGANATAVAIGATPASGAAGLTVASTSVASVAVPATIAAVGGFFLAYDISIVQDTTNRVIEGQTLWPAYIDAREETHQTMLFGWDPLR